MSLNLHNSKLNAMQFRIYDCARAIAAASKTDVVLTSYFDNGSAFIIVACAYIRDCRVWVTHDLAAHNKLG